MKESTVAARTGGKDPAKHKFRLLALNHHIPFYGLLKTKYKDHWPWAMVSEMAKWLDPAIQHYNHGSKCVK
jgi:hypothetical protein